MPEPIFTLGPIHTTFYSFILSLTIVGGMAWVVWQQRRVVRPAQIVDMLLVALAGGLLMGRVVHVLLNWDYFDLVRDEIWRLKAGGLDWRGACVGALGGLWLMARWRGVRLAALLDSVALVLPLLAIAGWWGCGASHCAYGAEVDNLSRYPAWLVWEEADIYNLIAPRYATQRLGMILAGAVLLGVLLVMWRDWLRGGRFWLGLMGLATVMFALGFLRGDYAVMVAGLRLGQWLDLAMVLLGVAGLRWSIFIKDRL